MNTETEMFYLLFKFLGIYMLTVLFVIKSLKFANASTYSNKKILVGENRQRENI